MTHETERVSASHPTRRGPAGTCPGVHPDPVPVPAHRAAEGASPAPVSRTWPASWSPGRCNGREGARKENCSAVSPAKGTHAGEPAMTEVTGDRNGAVYKAFKFTRHLSCTQGLEDGIFLEGVFPIPAVEPVKATPVGE